MTSSDEPDSPSLFGYGRGGVPGEFRDYITSRDIEALHARGEAVALPRPGGFRKAGVCAIASDLLEQLAQLRARRASAGPGRTSYETNGKATHDIRCQLYLLHAYCAHWRQAAPEELLKLTFEVMELSEQRPSKDISQLTGTEMHQVENVAAFLEASALDGEADAAGREISVSELAREVGVTRPTVRKWRLMDSYRRRQAFAAYVSAGTMTGSEDV